tara:strand:+ start:183 stop:431 length:249 start_codon:yes stop_codon:yes gene_type:complete
MLPTDEGKHHETHSPIFCSAFRGYIRTAIPNNHDVGLPTDVGFLTDVPVRPKIMKPCQGLVEKFEYVPFRMDRLVQVNKQQS